MLKAFLLVSCLVVASSGFQFLNPPAWAQQSNASAAEGQTEIVPEDRLASRLGFLANLLPGTVVREEYIPSECRLPDLQRFRSSAEDDMINAGASQWNYYETGSVFYGVLGLDSYELSDINNERVAEEDVIKLKAILTRSTTLLEEQTDYCDTETAEPYGDFWTPPGGHGVRLARDSGEPTWTVMDPGQFKLSTKAGDGIIRAAPVVAPRKMDPLKPFANAGDIAPNGVQAKADTEKDGGVNPLFATVEDPKVAGLGDRGTVTTRPVVLAIPIAAYYTYIALFALAAVITLAWSQYVLRDDIPDIDWPELNFRLNWADADVLGTDQLAAKVEQCLEDVGGCAGPIEDGDVDGDIDLCFEGSCINFQAQDTWHSSYPGKAFFQMSVAEPGWTQSAVPFTGLTMMMFEVMGQTACSPVEMVGLPVPFDGENFEWDAFDISAVGVSAMLLVGSVGSTVYSMNDPAMGGKKRAAKGGKGGKFADKIRADAKPAAEANPEVTKDEHGFSVMQAPTPTPTPRDAGAASPPATAGGSKRVGGGVLQRSSVGSRGSRKGGSMRKGTSKSGSAGARNSQGSRRNNSAKDRSSVGSRGSNRVAPNKRNSVGSKGSKGSKGRRGSNRSKGSQGSRK